MGNVAGGQLLQFRVGTLQSHGGAHSGDGSGDCRSSLVYGRVVDVSGATCGATQVAGEEATVAAGGRACSLTTVQCGATAVRPHPINDGNCDTQVALGSQFVYSLSLENRRLGRGLELRPKDGHL